MLELIEQASCGPTQPAPLFVLERCNYLGGQIPRGGAQTSRDLTPKSATDLKFVTQHDVRAQEIRAARQSGDGVAGEQYLSRWADFDLSG